MPNPRHPGDQDFRDDFDVVEPTRPTWAWSSPATGSRRSRRRPAFFGEPSGFDATVTNAGPDATDDVLVSVVFDNDAWTDIAAPGCTLDPLFGSGTEVRCLFGTLAAGESATAAITATPLATGADFAVDAATDGAEDDPDFGDNLFTLPVVPVVRTADLDKTLEITAGDDDGDGSILVGTELTVTSTYENLGPHDATDVSSRLAINGPTVELVGFAGLGTSCVLTEQIDPLGGGVTQYVDCTKAGSIPATFVTTWTHDVTIRPVETGALQLVDIAGSAAVDPNPGNNGQPLFVDVRDLTADLAVELTLVSGDSDGDGAVDVGDGSGWRRR